MSRIFFHFINCLSACPTKTGSCPEMRFEVPAQKNWFLPQKLDLLANFRVWHALVGRVESLHKRGLIHRDLKPGNFILVPRTYSDVGVLAQTPTPRAQFVYRLVDNDSDKPPQSQSNAQDSSSSSQCGMIEDVGVVRLSKCCLAFSVDDRMDCADLTKLMNRAVGAGWGVWGQGDIDSPAGDDDGDRLAGGAHASLVGDAHPRADVGVRTESGEKHVSV